MDTQFQFKWDGKLASLFVKHSHDFLHYLTTESGMQIRAVLFDLRGNLSEEIMQDVRAYMMTHSNIPAASDATRLFYASEMQRITGTPALNMFV